VLDAATDIAGQILREQGADRGDRPFDVWFVGRGGLAGGCRLTPRNRRDARKECERNALPWSQTIVSGTITGRAAAWTSRASMSANR
jgi:hypothetical protein